MLIYFSLMVLMGCLVAAYRFANINGVLRLSLPNWGGFFIVSGLISLVLIVTHSFFIQRFTIPSKSMLPTLQVGETIVVDPSYFGFVNPYSHTKFSNKADLMEIGDIVVARFPYAADVLYVKRIIGTQGDTVSLNRDGIKVNGILYPFIFQQELAENKSIYKVSIENKSFSVFIDSDEPFEIFNNIELKKGEVFLLGDNLTGSVDSRKLGPFLSENIIAKKIEN